MQEIKVRVVSESGVILNIAIVKTQGQVTKIQAEPNSMIQLYSDGQIINGDQKINDKKIKLKQKDSNLIIEVEGEPILEISDFFATEGASLDGSSWSFVNADGLVISIAESTVTPESIAALSPMLGIGGNTIMSGFAVAYGAGSALGGGGGSAAAASATSYVSAPTTFISGVITAGPVLNGHDLTVTVFDKDGFVLASNVLVTQQGRFTVDVGSYRGVISVKVINNSTNADYTDEYSNTGKDLNAVLTAVGVVTGSSLTLNINAITTIAAQKAGIGANGFSAVATLDITTVNQANADVATAFNVADITTSEPVTTLDINFETTVVLSNEEKIGALLAALSGLDNDNGGDSQITINRLVSQLTANQFSQIAITEIIAGSRNTDPTVLTDDLKTTVQNILGYNPVTNPTASISNALDVISAAAESNTASTLTLADFNAVTGLTGVTSANLSSIKSSLNDAEVVGVSVDTLSELQRLVDSYNLILNLADGSDNVTSTSLSNPNISQYGWIGIEGVTTATQAKLLSDVIDIKTNSLVNTVTFTGLSANTAYTYTFWAKLGSASNLDVVVTDGSGWNTLTGEKQYTSADGLNASTYTKIDHTFTSNSAGQVSIYLGANSETSLAAQSAGTVDLWGGRLHLAGETYIRTISVSATDSAGNTGAASTTTISITGTTPLMLDLNNDGIHTVGTQAGVVFDVDADGTPQSTGWTDGHDGLLVLDLNHDGVINNGAELFGSGTTLGTSPQAIALGAKAADGYAALAQYDADATTGLADGVIDANDTVFNSLQVWIDTNVDGVTDAGELKTLAEVGVKSLSLKAEKGTATENGNAALLQSTWTDTHGATHTLADWTLNTVEVHRVL